MRSPGLLLVVFLTACGGAEVAQRQDASWSSTDSAGVEIVESARSAWSEGEGWSLSEGPLLILHAMDGSEQNRLLDPTSIDVDGRGRIIIADGNQAGWDAVLVYDPEGRFLFQAGRSGEGPGEFGQLWWAAAYRGDSIVGFDRSRDRLTVFDPDGAFARQVRTPMLPRPPPARSTYGYTAGADAAYGDGHFLAYPYGSLDIEAGPGPAWYRHLLLRVRPDGEAWDTLGSFEILKQYWDGTQQRQYWFAPFSVSAVGRDELYFGTGETFEIRRHDSLGRLTRIIRRAHEPRPVTEALKGQLLAWYMGWLRSSVEREELSRVFETSQFAETLPAFSGLLLDPGGNLWVEEFRWLPGVERAPVTEPATWSVFDTAGIWRGDVTAPPGFILSKVTEDRALGFVVDEVGVKEVHVYELRRR